jgi:hypothetical protein
MSPGAEAIQSLTAAFTAPVPGSLEALAGHLAEGVVIAGPICPAEGKVAVLEALANPPRAGIFAEASWSDAVPDGDTVSVRATLPAGAPFLGMDLVVHLDGGLITAVDETLLRPPPPEPVAVDLRGNITDALGTALADGCPVVVAYVGTDEAPHLSFRGSTHVHDPDHLAIWVRDPAGGLLGAVGSNPNMSLLYRNPATATNYLFTGLGAVVDDPDTVARVYEETPAAERALDPRRAGKALLVEVVTVGGRGPSGPVRMERARQSS